MATDRVAEILKNSGEFSDEEIARMTEHEAWQWIHGHSPAPPPQQDRGERENGEPQ